MTYVAMSERLVSEILGVVYGMKQSELDAVPADQAPVIRKSDEQIMKAMWGVVHGTALQYHPELSVTASCGVALQVRGEVTQDFLDMQDDEFAESFDTHVVDDDVGELKLVLTTEAQVASGCAPRGFWISENGLYSTEHAVVVDESEDPRFKALLDNARARAEIAGRWRKVETEIGNYALSCKSLNEALKLWPEFERYVPKEYVAKARAGTTKKKDKPLSPAVAALAAMDMSAIVQSTVLARMAGAEVNRVSAEGVSS